MAQVRAGVFLTMSWQKGRREDLGRKKEGSIESLNAPRYCDEICSNYCSTVAAPQFAIAACAKWITASSTEQKERTPVWF